jgi:hypothetical protein
VRNTLSIVCTFFVLVISFLAPLKADAEPAIVYQYDSRSNVIGVNGPIGIGEPMDDCSQRIADVKVDEVVYEGASDIIVGFRATKPAPNEWYGIFRIRSDVVYKAIPNATRSDVQRLIKKGAQLIVTLPSLW